MITQIKSIKDIGVFKKFNPNDTNLEKDFGQCNLIYGLNTYGKSTVADIFKDLGNNTDERIQLRKTIPDGTAPEVIMGKSQGGAVHYKNGNWENNDFKDNITFC